MKYCDLHCDALTNGGVLQVTKSRLLQGGCFLQCFAAFVRRAPYFLTVNRLKDRFDALCAEAGYRRVTAASELKNGKINALFTVENGSAIEGEIEKLYALYARGARMMTLVWNDANKIGFPNFSGGGKGGRSFRARETEKGLTPFGFRVAEEMLRIGMLVDVSHGSDKLFDDVADLSRARGVPFVASHSGAASVFSHARNLTDAQLRTLADCGGVVGLVFCKDFLSADRSAEGQREALLSHARAILRAGGEDVLAIGSDFDGTAENPYIKNPACMTGFLSELEREFGTRLTEKIASENFLRVFRAVSG